MKTYTPLPVSSDLAQSSLEAALDMLQPTPHELVLHVSIEAFEEQGSWIEVTTGAWTRGQTVSIVMDQELSRREWYLENFHTEDRVGSAGP